MQIEYKIPRDPDFLPPPENTGKINNVKHLML